MRQQFLGAARISPSPESGTRLIKNSILWQCRPPLHRESRIRKARSILHSIRLSGAGKLVSQYSFPADNPTVRATLCLPRGLPAKHTRPDEVEAWETYTRRNVWPAPSERRISPTPTSV